MSETLFKRVCDMIKIHIQCTIEIGTHNTAQSVKREVSYFSSQFSLMVGRLFME